MAFSLHKRLGPTSYFGLAPPDSRGPRDDACVLSRAPARLALVATRWWW